MNVVVTTSNRRELPSAPAWLTLVLLACLTPAVAAQDSDDDGVLPKGGGGTSPATVDNGTGGGSPSVASLALGIHAWETPVAAPLFPDRAAITVVTAGGELVEVDTLAAVEDATVLATFHAPIRFQQLDTGLRFQGEAYLPPTALTRARLDAAPGAAARIAVALVHRYQPFETPHAFADILAGAAPADLVLVLGDVPSLDLTWFDAWARAHAARMPGAVVSVAFVSVDAAGGLHVAGARASADGTPLEVSAR